MDCSKPPFRATYVNAPESKNQGASYPRNGTSARRSLKTLAKEATVRRYHYESLRQLEHHLAAFPDAYNFARQLKTLRDPTTYEAICKARAETPKRFRLDPVQLTSVLDT